MLLAQRAQDAGVGRVACLALAQRLEAEVAEEHLGELLRRADRERAAGELVDAVGELVDAVAHARRDLAETIRVHAHAGLLHAREHAHERQLDLAEELLETEVEEPRPLGRGDAPRARRASGGRVHRVEVDGETRLAPRSPASASRVRSFSGVSGASR